MKDKITQDEIIEWFRTTTGNIHLRDAKRELELASGTFPHLRTVFSRMVQDNIAVRIAGKDGWYRLVDEETEIIHFKNGEVNPFDIKWPYDANFPKSGFGIENLAWVDRGGLAVVGGSPNAGKSALAHNLIHCNYKKHRVILYDSDNSEAEIVRRVKVFPTFMQWPDDCIQVKDANFEDAIAKEPDALHIVDYLEITDSFWLVAKHLRAIKQALGKGIAVVMLQKAKGAELPYGRDFTQQIPRLAISMEAGMLTITKGKTWANPEVNPNGKKFTFKLVGGEKFINIRECYD